jgi:glycerol-3-phosphate acyltransferase PlsY
MIQCSRTAALTRKPALLELGVKFLLAYFIGSVMGSMIMGRLRGGVDIREAGSGNPGGTNALRTQGALFALGVIIVDIGKGVMAVAAVPGLSLPGIDQDPAVSRIWLAVACAAAAVVGHIWPVWHRFNGGKGAATVVGTLTVLQASLLWPVVLVWVWTLVLSGYVGLATMCAAVAAPVYLAIFQLPADVPLFVYCSGMALLLIYSHRSNIQRMKSGTESRYKRVMVFSRRQAKAENAGD